MRPLDEYYLAAFAVTGLGALAIGLLPVRRSNFTSYAIIVGCAANVATQLPEGGPGLCLGMIAVPLEVLIVIWIGRGIRTVLIAAGYIPAPPPEDGIPRCRKCGYCLIGLPGDTCPECGGRITGGPERP